MARRSDHSREELYEMSLAAAHDIVVSDGLPGLTVRKVATEIGYSPGTIYNVFEDFYELIIHLNGRTLDMLDEHMQGILGKLGQPKLNDIVAAYLVFIEDNRDLWNVLFDYRLPEGRQLPDWYLAKIGKVLSVVENLLRKEVPSADNETAPDMARVFWAGLHGICTLYGSGKLQVVSQKNLQAMTASYVSVFLAGLNSNAAAA